MREAVVKRHNTLDLLDMILGENDLKSFDVRVQMLYLTPTDDGEDVRSPLENIRNSHYERSSPETHA